MNLIPDWLLPTVALAPAMVWTFLGLGLPWAFALLPRGDWRRPATLVAVSLALGPALLTMIMFIIGTFWYWDVPLILGISALTAGIGAIIAWRQRTGTPDATPGEHAPDSPFDALDWTLALVVAVAVILRFWNTAYWPFTTYDALWVYGSNARLFLLEGHIPAHIGYYPQHVPLAYTFAQLLWGSINDHAARVVIPWFALAGIVASYVLGGRLFGRRAGLLAAALWALYPHHAAWSQFGDLEVTVTLYFTMTAALFALGWRDRQPRYLIVSGLMLGVALWTKPTAGALIQSAILLGAGGLAVCVWAARRGDSGPCAWRDLPRAALISLIAAFPIGGIWYVRNVLFGHDPIVLPAGYWQAAAQRSGQELGWPLLILAALALIVWQRGERKLTAALGVALFAAGMLPSAFGGRLPSMEEMSVMLAGQIPVGIMPARLGVAEYALIALGAGLVMWAVWPSWRELPVKRRGVNLILLAFIVPYFITWFWSYSYHFRLSFPIVPLLMALLAGLIVRAFAGLRLTRLRLAAAVALVLALAVPGWWAVLTALEPAATGALATDDIKIARGNPALMALVDFLRAEREKLGRPMRVIAPGELRLSFFFPQDDIEGDVFPLWLDEIADVDFYIDSSVSQKLYAIRGELFNQIVASRTRAEVLQRVFTTDDGNFRFSVYTIDNAARFVPPQPNGPIGAQIGDFARLQGYDLSTLIQLPGEALYLTLYWEALGPAPLDYSVFIHLWDPVNERLIAQWDSQPMENAFFVWQNVPGDHFNVPYPTRLWQAGEFIRDDRRMVVPNDAPPGTYELRTGLFDPASNTRLPVTRDGEPADDSVLLNRIEIRSR